MKNTTKHMMEKFRLATLCLVTELVGDLNERGLVAFNKAGARAWMLLVEEDDIREELKGVPSIFG